MLEDLSPAKILIVVLLFVIFFGAKKIPEIAQGLGKGMREFRKATREFDAPDDEETPPAGAATPGSAMIPCLHCGAPVAKDAKFCPVCGKSLGPKKCSRCAALNRPDDKFCGECGESLS
jgi:sec-independent protein translocase protein TatA